MATRIAVFNHSPQLLKLYEANLGARGFEVTTFIEALTSLEQLRDIEAELFILGNVTGYDKAEIEFLIELRTDPQVADIPIIICTTAAFHLLDGLNQVPDIFVLTKPFEIEQLLDCIHQALKLTPSNLAKAQ
jgi:DNA-binding response OmpR family regulator